MFCLANKLDLCDDTLYASCDINHKDGTPDDPNLVTSDASCLTGKYIKFLILTYCYIINFGLFNTYFLNTTKNHLCQFFILQSKCSVSSLMHLLKRKKVIRKLKKFICHWRHKYLKMHVPVIKMFSSCGNNNEFLTCRLNHVCIQ